MSTLHLRDNFIWFNVKFILENLSDIMSCMVTLLFHLLVLAPCTAVTVSFFPSYVWSLVNSITENRFYLGLVSNTSEGVIRTEGALSQPMIQYNPYGRSEVSCQCYYSQALGAGTYTACRTLHKVHREVAKKYAMYWKHLTYRTTYHNKKATTSLSSFSPYRPPGLTTQALQLLIPPLPPSWQHHLSIDRLRVLSWYQIIRYTASITRLV